MPSKKAIKGRKNSGGSKMADEAIAKTKKIKSKPLPKPKSGKK